MEHNECNWAIFQIDFKIDSGGVTADYSYHVVAESAFDVMVWLVNLLDLLPKYVPIFKPKYYKNAEELTQYLTNGWNDMWLVYDAKGNPDEFIQKVHAKIHIVEGVQLDPSRVHLAGSKADIAPSLVQKFKQTLNSEG